MNIEFLGVEETQFFNSLESKVIQILRCFLKAFKVTLNKINENRYNDIGI